MSKRIGILVFALLGLLSTVSAQIVNGLDTLYGNEWISPGNDYLRLEVQDDGFYSINYADIQAQGWPVDAINSGDYQLFHQGELIPFHSTQDQGLPLGSGDALIFYGKKNRGELDRHIYREPDAQQLNPAYSLYSDTGVYYLTYAPEGGLQYETVANDLTNLPAAEPYVWQQEEVIFDDFFVKEYYRFSGATIYYSHFSIGEGYGNRSINQLLADGSTSQEVTLNLPQAYAAGPPARLQTRYVAALFDHIQRLSANEQILRTDTFFNWAMQNVDMDLPMAVLQDGELRLEWEGFGGPKDEVSVGYVSVDYPTLPDAAGSDNFSCQLSSDDQRQYLEVANWSGANAIVYDLQNNQRLIANNNGGTLQIALPDNGEERELVIISSETDLPAPNISPVALAIPDLGDADYVILTHSLLRAGSEDAVQAYADYRASAAGGNYRTAIVNIDQLFDQFCYGIQQHPLAIRNFVAWQRKVNPAFEFLFIVGKGREYIDLREPSELQEALGSTLFVPSFGFPASDNLLVSSLEKPTPLVNIGRLPVVSGDEVRLYLNKVRGMEEFVASSPQTLDGRSWMKNVLHLGGGGNASEQQSIKNNLESMGAEIENGRFGGRITGFYKTSLDPIQTSQTDQIFNRINQGVSLITFFGHSSASGFDFSIDQPENYDNQDKYPLMISLGCYSGNMFDNFRSVGEEFILLENGGAGAFLASRGLGFIHALGNVGRRFHSKIGEELYGATIGEGIRSTIAEFEHLTDQAYGTLNEQFSLQGDPALRLNPLPGDDYTIDPNSVKVEPVIVNVQSDSFQVSFDLYNLGVKQADNVTIRIIQQLPNGEEVFQLDQTIPSTGYSQSVSLNLPSLGRRSIGLNRLLIEVDPSNSISELPSPAAETNNELILNNGERGFPFFIIDDTAIPVWPKQYALVGDLPITLKASTANALAPERRYFLEIATEPSFTAPLDQTEITVAGGVLRWTPNLSWQDSTVYYWRVAPDTVGSIVPSLNWEASSFQYIEGISPGWGQAHWGQIGDNEFDQVNLDTLSEKLIYTKNFLNVALRNKVYDPDDRPTYFNQFQFINSPWTWSIHEGLNVVVLEYPTLDYWRNPFGGLYGSVNTASNWPSGVLPFAYRTEQIEDRTNLINFLTEVIPDSSYVIIYSAQRTQQSDFYPEQWAADSIVLDGKNIFNVLEAEGAIRIRDLATEGATPYVLFYQKGVQYIGEGLSETIDGDAYVEHAFEGLWYEGEMVTVPAGQVEQWNQLSVRFMPGTVESSDSIRLVLEASSEGQTWSEVWSVAEPPQIYYEYDLQSVNANEFPYLRLRYYVYDIEQRTAPQLDYVHFYHDPLAELAISPNTAYSFTDSLVEGQELRLVYAIENLGISTIEDVPISYQFNNLSVTDQPDSQIQLLAPDEIYFDTLILSTVGSSGNYEIITTVNPGDSPKEGFRFNNVNVNQGRIATDQIDPVIDVVFDGSRILDGDLVAPQPQITVSITDENPYLPLTDSDLISVFLQRPETGAFEHVDASTYNWTPADLSSGENEARIDFQPDLPVDGIYGLRIRATDESANPAGRILYEVSFEVVNRQTISHILPYPNPFVDQTRFVYTLTGESPSRFGIQIMTVSGRIVKEIDQASFGELRVGTHQSDYVWDGTDNYGDQLANGVYLYRVVAEDETGQAIEIRDNGSSGYFQNGLGKIVLLR